MGLKYEGLRQIVYGFPGKDMYRWGFHAERGNDGI